MERYHITKVKNLKNTSDKQPEVYNSWLKYWEENSGEKAIQCAHYNCDCKERLNGAHVKKVNGNDNSWFIVPLCDRHNHYSQEFEFEVVGKLIPVNEENLQSE